MPGVIARAKRITTIKGGLLDRVAVWLKDPSVGVGSALMGWGLLLVGLSWALGNISTQSVAAACVDHARCIDFGTREVGFVFAPNWSLTGVAIWPAMYFALAGMLKQATQVCEAIDASPMGWLAASRPVPCGVALSWQRHRFALAVLVIVLSVTMTLVSLAEWWQVSGSLLIGGRARTATDELDWSIAMLGRGMIRQYAAALFSMLAYLYQAAVLVMLFTFAGITLLMARTIGRHGSGSAQPPLIVDVGSNDPNDRVGFEKFVPMIDYMILFVFLAYTNFLLTRVQNAYLRSPESDSLLAFLEKDLSLPTSEHLDRLFAVTRWDWSSGVVSIGAMIVLFQCFFFFNASLRHAAIQARNRSDQALMTPALLRRAKRYGLEIKDIQQRLHAANVWPLGYSDILPTLSLLVICMLSIPFYRIGIYIVLGWIASWVVLRSAIGVAKKAAVV